MPHDVRSLAHFTVVRVQKSSNQVSLSAGTYVGRKCPHVLSHHFCISALQSLLHSPKAGIYLAIQEIHQDLPSNSMFEAAAGDANSKQQNMSCAFR